jgi:release factor glutamine methyltransferase
LSDPSEALVARLRAAGCVFAEDEAALLEAEASGDALELLVRRRVAGEPLEQVLGWTDFGGLRVRVTPGVFVPRQRTLRVAELAVELAPTGGVLVDLCCGSGAIAAYAGAHRPDLDVHAAELDPDAVACARLNVAQVHAGDLYGALPADLRGRVDVLAVNAPYVPTAEIALMPPEAREHEHHVALDGGDDGLDLHRRVADGAARWLAPDGVLLLETSPRQEPGTVRACERAGLLVEVVGEDPVRVVLARPARL